MSDSQQLARQIFGEAVALKDLAERRAHVDRACAGNAGLRAEVESLLRAFEQAGDFLGRTMQLPASDIVVERTGTMIGRYKLLQKIGEGGFGVVFMAEQVEPVQRKVALKIIKAGMDTREVVARFEVERQALALMDHANIARVLDAGTTEAGRPYFVMELVRGIPITEYCNDKHLPTNERLQLFMQVCHAVQHAHHKGIIHRDLKPGNVLVTLHDDEAVPKVIDFGVAKALGQKLTEKTLFTAFQHMIGTPAYMSPEQAELSGLDIDTRSDIYSLGVLLYELLTGSTPFDADTLRNAPFDEVRRMIRETEPPKPSTRLQALGAKLSEVAKQRQAEPETLRRLVRGDLDWIVMKCLEKNRQRRYETADALAQDLTRHLHNEAVLASPPSVAYRVEKFARRNRVAVSFAAVVVLALLIGLCSTLLALKRARQEKARAEADAAIATAINDFLQSSMLDTLTEHYGGNAVPDSRGKLDALAGNIERQFAGQPLVEAAVRFTLGRTYASLGVSAAAEPQIQRAAEIRRKELGPEHPATLEALGALGFLRFNQGNPAEAEPLLQSVLAAQRRVLGEGDPATIQTLVMLGAVQSQQGGTTLAPDLLKAIRSLREDDPRTLRALHSVVDTLRSEKRLTEAEKLGRELLGKRERVLGANHSETVQALLCLSYTMKELNRLDECEQLRREAMRRGRETNPTGAETLAAFNQLLELLTERADYDAAQRLLEEELGVERRALGPENPTTQSTQAALDRMIQLNSSLGPAGQRLAEADKQVAQDNSDGGAWLRRALARSDLRQWKSASHDFESAVTRTNFANEAKAADFGLTCLELARRALDAKQYELAEQAPREALRLFRRLEQEHPGRSRYPQEVGHSLWHLGDALAATDRHEEARRTIQEALKVFEQAAAKYPGVPYLRQEQAFSHRKLVGLVDLSAPTKEGERELRIAIEIYAALKKEHPTNTWYALEESWTTWDLAKALRRANRLADAETDYRQVLALNENGMANFPDEPEFKSRQRNLRRELAELLVAIGKRPEPGVESEYSAKLLLPGAWKGSWSPDSERIAFGKHGGGIAVLELASKRVTDLVSKGQDPAWSPDGRFIAYVTAAGQAYYSEMVWIISTNGDKAVKIGQGGFPSWSADSSQLIFHSRARNQILAACVDDTNAEPAVFFAKPLSWYPAVAPDGARIAFGAEGRLDIVDHRSGETVASLPTPGERGLLPAWSPDGKRVAFGGFAGSEAGLWIYDIERHGAFQVATGGECTMPAWSPDGKRLAFDHRAATNEIWVIETSFLPREPVLTERLPARASETRQASAPAETQLVGKPVPGKFSLPMLNGSKFVLPAQQSTNVLLLDFWATWCGPCRQAMPTLAEIAKTYWPRGVRYVAINLRERPDVIRRYLTGAKLDIEVALDADGGMAGAFQVQGIPTMVVVDREGTVRKVHVGSSPKLGDELRAALEEVLKQAPSGVAADEGSMDGDTSIRRN